MNNLAIAYAALGRHADAVKLAKRRWRCGKPGTARTIPQRFRTMNNLANGYSDLGRHADALKLREETLALQKAKLPPDHPDTFGACTTWPTATPTSAGTPTPSSSGKRRWRCGKPSWAPPPRHAAEHAGRGRKPRPARSRRRGRAGHRRVLCAARPARSSIRG